MSTVLAMQMADNRRLIVRRVLITLSNRWMFACHVMLACIAYVVAIAVLTLGNIYDENCVQY